MAKSFASTAFLCVAFIVSSARAQAPAQLDACNVVWTTPSADSSGSMPLGNGDIGLNAWVEKSGDLLFYIGKNDAWSGDLTSPGYGAYGLIKVGRVRVSLSPNPFTDASTFRQELRLRDGAMEVSAGPADKRTTLLLWVDANRPVIHVQATSAAPTRMTVTLESWRKQPTDYLAADTVVSTPDNQIVWYYANPNKQIPQLVNRTIGAAIEGPSLQKKDDLTLQSTTESKSHHVAVHPLTAQSPTPQQWRETLSRQITATNSIPLDQAWREHQQWWQQFWNRSWIFVSGADKTTDLTTGYILQRFKHACSSRGQFPIKFNGSIFNVDDPKPVMANDKVPGQPNVKRQVQMEVTADFRSWGHMYWFQNTRHMYWPMMMSGDFDLMKPLFAMYSAQLPGNTKQVREFYGHDGAYFRETAPFWGGLEKITPEDAGYYTKHYYTPILELSTMMLDYFAYTGDRTFAKETLLPMADAGVTFYDQHFGRDANGKLKIEPANAIEMFWKVRNNLPDVAGLHVVLRGLLALPPDLTDPTARARWQRLLSELPPVPIGERDGKKQLLPYEEGQNPPKHNSENPELYAVYPFRLYGLGKPDLDLAANAFAARKFKAAYCWHQDGVQAALVGDVETARKSVITYLTNRDKRLRFPAFWAKGHDYAPDEDNGGNGMVALQHMLLQADDNKILLLSAWPKDWDVQFKLHAPQQTTVEGVFEKGRLQRLTVTPASRRAQLVLPPGIEEPK